MKLQIAVALAVVYLSNCPAQADCDSDADAINKVMANAGPYREVQNIKYADEDIKTVIGDVNFPTGYRQTQINIAGQSGQFLYEKNRMWSTRKDQSYIENTSSSAKGIAEGQIKSAQIQIDYHKYKVTCGFQDGEFNTKMELLEWQDRESTSVTRYQLWVDAKTHLAARRTWDYIALGDIANNHAVSVFLYSDRIVVRGPN